MKRVALIASALLAGCTPGPPPAARESEPAFDPIAFFTGATHGTATLAQVFKSDRSMTVQSEGTLAPNGTLTLRQRISVRGAPTRMRTWIMRRVRPGVYGGSLTDAVGPVETRAVGRAIRIRYEMKGGLRVEQWLYALPGGRALDNRLDVTKWGIELASVRERITKG